MKNINDSKNAKKFNATINKVKEEMLLAEEVLCKWGVSCKESLAAAYCYDLQFLTEEQIRDLEEVYYGQYDLTNGGDTTPRVGAALRRDTLVDKNGEEYICEFRKIDLLATSNKIGRMITYLNTGEIGYSHIKRNRRNNDESYDYYAKYDVNTNGLEIRFIRENEDLSVILDKDRRIFNSDGITVIQDTDGMEVSVDENNYRYIVNFDSMNRIDSKVLITNEERFVICGNEVVSATRCVDGEDVELEITDELRSRVNEILSQLSIGTLNKYELETFISSMKIRLVNAVKGIKGDVPLKGLSKRLDILLAMINTKSLPKENIKDMKKVQRKIK